MKHSLSQRLQYALLIPTLLTLPALAVQKPNVPTVRGASKSSPALRHKPSEAEIECVLHMLGASTLAEAKARKAKCKDSFVLRAYFASRMVQLHAPGADNEIICNLPQNAAEMDALYAVSDASEPDTLLLVHAYECYYKSIFRIVAARPQLLPKFFAIAYRFGSRDPDNVDEDEWFTDELHQIYERIPMAYMGAVRRTKNKQYRDFALYCRKPGLP